MRIIIQRISSARLICKQPASKQISKEIGRGIVSLVGIESDDDESRATRMAERLLSYRIFPDSNGRMNLSLSDIGGDLLIVPNFTVAADTRKGTRAGFSTAATPETGARLFDSLTRCIQQQHDHIETGIFGADMQLTLTNDGPVTFILQS